MLCHTLFLKKGKGLVLILKEAAILRKCFFVEQCKRAGCHFIKKKEVQRVRLQQPFPNTSHTHPRSLGSHLHQSTTNNSDQKNLRPLKGQGQRPDKELMQRRGPCHTQQYE
uniref:Uncharacterized protein n=1 Tax=Setaria italica TaxID=4555 RepID=K4A0B3_SETIT